MPTGISPGAQGDTYVVTTPDFWLPLLTPLSSMATPQGSQDMAPAQQDQDPVNAQAAGSPRAASPATAGASLIPMGFPWPTAAAPAVSSAASTAAAGSPAGPVAAPTACTVVASVEAAEVSMALAQTPAGAIAASPAAASLVPASAAAARTAGHGPVAVLPLFSGAQKRTASAIAQQVCTLKQWHQFMFVRFLLSALIAYSGAKSNPVNKPCVYCMSVNCALYRPMRTICLPLTCIALRDKGRFLKRMQHCPVMQLLHSKVLPCDLPCSLASSQVSTCTHFVHGTTYPCLHLPLTLHCATGNLLRRSILNLWSTEQVMLSA